MLRLLLLALWWSGPSAQTEPEVPAEITDPAARDHFAVGMQAWLEQDYPRAQSELEAAYALDPAPVLLYSLGQLFRLQGDCDRARARFLAFLETKPPEAAAADTRVNLERCEPRASSVVVPQAETTVVLEQPPEPRAVPSRRPDALGVSLVAVGAVVATAGAGLFGGAFAVHRQANDGSGIDAFERGIRRANAMYWGGAALMTVGAGVLIGGIVRLVLVRRRQRSPAGTGLAWRGVAVGDEEDRMPRRIRVR